MARRQRKDWPILRYDPERSDVNEIARAMQELTGEEWTGWHIEHSKVPGAALIVAFRRQESSGRFAVAGLMLLAEDALKADSLRAVPIAALENSKNITERPQVLDEVRKLPRLDRKDAGSPEEFSRRVARHYQTWATVVPNPVAAMAAEYGITAPTVHSWVREARLRGDLPKSTRKRKA